MYVKCRSIDRYKFQKYATGFNTNITLRMYMKFRSYRQIHE